MSMVAVLPTSGVPLSSVLNALANASIVELVQQLNKTRDYFSVTDVTVRFPKFKISTGLDLNGYLADMGIREVFNANQADLSGISPTAMLYVSKALHKAEIETDEEGTVGSSVTVAEFTDRYSDVENFKADRPFAFIVYDKVSKAVVFAGKFIKPN